MIQVTRLDGTEFFINAEFVQQVESRPDTHIVLVNGHSFIVTEPDHEVVDRIFKYRRRVSAGGAQAYLRVVDADAEQQRLQDRG